MNSGMRIFIGAITLLTLIVGFLFLFMEKQDTDTVEVGSPGSIVAQQDLNDMTTSAVPIDPSQGIRDDIRELEADIRQAKEDGSAAAYIAELERLKQLAMEELDRTPVKFTEQVTLDVVEEEIRYLKEIGLADSSLMMTLEQWREEELQKPRKTIGELLQDKREKRASMSDEELIAHYKDELTHLNGRLQKAQAENDTEQIKSIETWIEVKEDSLQWVKDAPKRKRQDEQLDQMERELDDMLRWAQDWEDTLIEEYKPYLNLKEVDGRMTIESVRSPEELMMSDLEPSIFGSDIDSQQRPSALTQQDITKRVPRDSFVKAESKFNAWRQDIDGVYFDVLLSGYMTPEELDIYFPTKAERENLVTRKARLQGKAISKIRSLLSGLQNATTAEKRKLAKELVGQHFDKSFAESVLERLEFNGYN